MVKLYLYHAYCNVQWKEVADVRDADHRRMLKVGSMRRRIHTLEPEIASVRHVAEKEWLRMKVHDDDTP